MNALSNNMILCDRKQLKNPNGLILGTPGSGKSFAAKREITNALSSLPTTTFLSATRKPSIFPLCNGWRASDPVIPHGEGYGRYAPVRQPYGYELKLQRGRQPPCLKSDFILSLCELVIGGKEGLQPIDKTVIDRAVSNVYRPLFLADPAPAKMPILGDLYNELLRQPEPEAARIAAALELYVSGSLNVFNHRTNVELKNRLVCL